jgi:hypothetical protein
MIVKHDEMGEERIAEELNENFCDEVFFLRYFVE